MERIADSRKRTEGLCNNKNGLGRRSAAGRIHSPSKAIKVMPISSKCYIGYNYLNERH